MGVCCKKFSLGGYKTLYEVSTRKVLSWNIQDDKLTKLRYSSIDIQPSNSYNAKIATFAYHVQVGAWKDRF
jgi:hypothetical protein